MSGVLTAAALLMGHWFSAVQMRDQARRFITLVDELYNAKTPLFVSADASPMELFTKPGDTPVLDLEGLQFETAISGLPRAACTMFKLCTRAAGAIFVPLCLD